MCLEASDCSWVTHLSHSINRLSDPHSDREILQIFIKLNNQKFTVNNQRG